MNTALDVKEAIREGWSHPDRVEGWTESALYREFIDPDIRREWLASLRVAAAGADSAAALDVGTGPGTLALLWAEMGLATTGLDFSPGMLTAGRKAAKEHGLAVDFVEGDAEHPLFPVESFDIVSSRFVLFTLPHPGVAVRRWISLLRPGGVLVLVGHDRPSDAGRVERPPARGGPKRKWQAGERQREALAQLPFVHHSSNDLRVLMEAAGLDNIHFVSTDKIVATRKLVRERETEINPLESRPFILMGRRNKEP